MNLKNGKTSFYFILSFLFPLFVFFISLNSMIVYRERVDNASDFSHLDKINANSFKIN